QQLSLNGQCQTLSIGPDQIEVLIDDTYADYELKIEIQQESVTSKTKGEKESDPAHVIAALMQYEQELLRSTPKAVHKGKAYTRDGMMRRVLEERRLKAAKAEYKIVYGPNPYGEHRVYNEKGVQYNVTFHDLPKGTGYCTCPDFQTNKLGTCKHLLFAYMDKKGDKSRLKKPRTRFPFVDVFLDPKKDYQIKWFHPDPHQLPDEVQELLQKHFRDGHYFDESQTSLRTLLNFIREAEHFKQILIRPEVLDVVDRAFHKNLLQQVGEAHQIDWSVIKAALYPYQKRGVEFAAYKEGVIIADEMGLGKTLQAITTALVKKEAFGFANTLVVCPASVKSQWKQEIEKFTDVPALVVSGTPEERAKQYLSKDIFFFIVNYETVLRDWKSINKMELDFVILDEAQRIKNYETLTARAIKKLDKKHGLVITGTPIENRLLDLFSIMDFVDPHFLTPLWEFSYQHCYFDQEKKDKIVGYFNLQNLKARLSNVLIRRTKREVIEEMPEVTQLDIPVVMHPDQAMYHTNYASGVVKILRKKYLTPYDFNRLMMLLNQMRMVCDSTFLIDQETHGSPKLIELRYILLEKLDVV
ncbi:MAG: SNF2-related protein, partial [Bacteroidota bacterium]